MSTFHTNIFRYSPLVALVAVFAGCERKEVRHYTVPKDKPDAPMQPTAEQPEETEREPWRPSLKFAAPAGWKELGPEGANVARFSAGEASVAVTALVSMAGKEAVLVNMYRQMKGQPALSDTEAAKSLVDVAIAGGGGKMIESPEVIVAFIHRPDGSLFFKLQGSPDAVAANKAGFIDFLKTVQLESAATAAVTETKPTAAAEPSAIEAGPIPAGWTKVAPGPMQAAKFTVQEKDGKKAEVTVSIFPGETGTLLANINRWRGQVGLPPTDEAGLKDCTAPLDSALPGAVLADLKGESKSLLGAIVPRDGQWYFYKLTGDAPAVIAARDSFIGFAKLKP